MTGPERFPAALRDSPAEAPAVCPAGMARPLPASGPSSPGPGSNSDQRPPRGPDPGRVSSTTAAGERRCRRRRARRWHTRPWRWKPSIEPRARWRYGKAGGQVTRLVRWVPARVGMGACPLKGVSTMTLRSLRRAFLVVPLVALVATAVPPLARSRARPPRVAPRRSPQRRRVRPRCRRRQRRTARRWSWVPARPRGARFTCSIPIPSRRCRGRSRARTRARLLRATRPSRRPSLRRGHRWRVRVSTRPCWAL